MVHCVHIDTSQCRHYLGETKEQSNATGRLHSFVDVHGDLLPARLTWTCYVHRTFIV